MDQMDDDWATDKAREVLRWIELKEIGEDMRVRLIATTLRAVEAHGAVRGHQELSRHLGLMVAA
jgi:hypothetical protein